MNFSDLYLLQTQQNQSNLNLIIKLISLALVLSSTESFDKIMTDQDHGKLQHTILKKNSEYDFIGCHPKTMPLEQLTFSWFN